MAQDFVVIGDSLSCGGFGKALVKNLTAKGSHVSLFCAVDSAPANWLDGVTPKGRDCMTMTSEKPAAELCGGNGQVPKLSEILAQHPGARVVVALGTNSLLSAHVDRSFSALARIARSYGTSCDWVGPPHLNPAQSNGFPAGRVAREEQNLNTFYDSLSSAVDSRCAVQDSRDATAPRTPGYDTIDGVHRTDTAGKYWADPTVKQLLPPPSTAPIRATETTT